MANVGLVYHPDFLKHKTGPMHPERPERLTAIMSLLEDKGLVDKLKRIEPKPAEESWITSVHSPQHVTSLRAVAVQAGDDLRSEERRVGKECRSRWSPYH